MTIVAPWMGLADAAYINKLKLVHWKAVPFYTLKHSPLPSSFVTYLMLANNNTCK